MQGMGAFSGSDWKMTGGVEGGRRGQTAPPPALDHDSRLFFSGRSVKRTRERGRGKAGVETLFEEEAESLEITPESPTWNRSSQYLEDECGLRGELAVRRTGCPRWREIIRATLRTSSFSGHLIPFSLFFVKGRGVSVNPERVS